MVEHLVANQMMGVRFSLPALLRSPVGELRSARHRESVHNIGDTGDKGQETFTGVREIMSK